jgi:hypothetical protein
MSRHVKEYCRHCLCEQWGTWKGNGLYCHRDHLMRTKHKQGTKKVAGSDKYEELRYEINRTFHGKGQYDWAELEKWARNCGFNDLASFCSDMEQVEQDLSL